MRVLIGIDIGTTNWKVGAFSEDGRLLSLHKTPTVTRSYGPDADFYDPDQLWQSVARLAQSVVAECGAEEITAVSVTSMAESVVPIDRTGAAIFPIIPWFDTRARREAAYLADLIGVERLFEITGADPNPIFGLPKILWIKANQPDVFERAAKWLQMADFIYLKLCGVQVTDYSLASRMLAFDLSNGIWSAEILAKAGVSEETLPEIALSGQVIGSVNSVAAQATGLPVGIPVVVGGHDHLCATLPTGVALGNKVLDSSGTAESFIFLAQKRPEMLQSFRGLRVGSYLDPDRYAFWGGIISSGKSVDWGVERLVSAAEWGITRGEFTYDDLMDQIASVPPGADGALYLPHLRGSGAPYWDPRSKGAFLGLKSRHTNRELLRALFEGLSYQARMIVESAEKLAGFNVDTLCAVGGGTRLKLWQQIKADVTGKVVETQAIEDATLLGAAMIAGIGVGLFSSLEAAAQIIRSETQSFVPNPANQALYDTLYEIYAEANQALATTNTRLDDQFRLG